MRVALLEDDPDQAAILCAWLAEAGYTCRIFASGTDYLREIGRETYDLHILDWNVPGVSGEEALKVLRDRVADPVPVMFVTARDSEEDVVHILTLGADDYLAKPLRRAETLARVAALTRRGRPRETPEGNLLCPPFTFRQTTRVLERDGVPLDMTPKDFELALYMFRHPGKLLSRAHILESVWGKTATLDTRTVDTHISRIRRKLDLNGGVTGWRLASVYLQGYRLEKVVV
jgi:two-component system response regulator RegX3